MPETRAAVSPLRGVSGNQQNDVSGGRKIKSSLTVLQRQDAN